MSNLHQLRSPEIRPGPRVLIHGESQPPKDLSVVANRTPFHTEPARDIRRSEIPRFHYHTSS
jgi:hypothetical protein